MKKILALIVAAVMLLSLCACGASVDTAKLDEIQAALDDIQASLDQLSAGGAAPEEEPAEAPAAPAGETETLPIGLMVHTTGWFAGVDTPNFNEFNAMVDYINQNGGWTVGDTTYILEPVFVDGQSDYPTLRTAAMSLVDAGVDFVVETNDFWVNSCADVFEDEGILHASAYCVGSNTGYLIPENPLAFTGTLGTIGDYQACFKALSENYPEVQSVILANDDNGLKEEMLATMKALAEPYGIEVKDSIVIYPGDTTDYSSYAQQIVDSGADAFMGNGSPDAYGALLKAVRALGSDCVMACAQGKPISMIMEYAGADASYNGFSLGASVFREEDRANNTDIMNDLADAVGEKYGDDAKATFDGAAANTLYLMLQMMQKAGSIDPEAVAAAWTEGGEVETIYGTGIIGGTETYGVENHAIGHPRPVSVMDPDAEDGWYFAGWVTEIDVP